MIPRISISSDLATSEILIAPGKSRQDNWLTVFIGENGSKKSFLLRCLTEGALGRGRYRINSTGQPVLVDLFASPLPSRVIAISGTPLDRFPRTGTADLRSRLKSKRNNKFVYLGQRAANGMSGVWQSERSLLGSLLSNQSVVVGRLDEITKIFGRLGLQSKITLRLRPNNKQGYELMKLSDRAHLDEDGIAKILNSMLLYNADVSDTVSQDLTRVARTLANDRDRLHKLISLVKDDAEVSAIVDLQHPVTKLKGMTVEQSELGLLINVGLFQLVGTAFYKAGEAATRRVTPIEGDRLSSGQWNWLATLAGLCAEIREGSLVLVDEPENSLHPSWQQEYVPTLQRIVRQVAKCQTIIATHSPLIASGVAPETGNVRALFRQPRTGKVVSKFLEPTYGWSASDVYETAFELKSTRAPDFTKIANQALLTISKNSPITEQERAMLIDTIKADASHLPALDPLRDILLTISQQLGNSRTRGKGR